MIRTIIAASVLAVCPALVLQAGIIYSDFGAGESFDQDGGEVVSQSVDLRPSLSFILGVAQELTEVDFVTSIDDSGDVNQVTVTLSSDQGGHPGTALATQEFTNAMGVLGGEPTDPPLVISWILSTPEDLSAGDTYWVTLDGPAPGDVTWNGNNQGQSGYSTFESGEWMTNPTLTLGAIQILGESEAAVPEPGTALLLGLGLAAVIGLRRGALFSLSLSRK